MAAPSPSTGLIIKTDYGGDLRRLRFAEVTSFAALSEVVRRAYGDKEESLQFTIKYEDEDGDWVTVTMDSEYADAVQAATREKRSNLRLAITSRVVIGQKQTKPVGQEAAVMVTAAAPSTEIETAIPVTPVRAATVPVQAVIESSSTTTPNKASPVRDFAKEEEKRKKREELDAVDRARYANHRYSVECEVLVGMGFRDRALNIYILEAKNGNTMECGDWLLKNGGRK